MKLAGAALILIGIVFVIEGGLLVLGGIALGSMMAALKSQLALVATVNPAASQALGILNAIVWVVLGYGALKVIGGVLGILGGIQLLGEQK